MFYEVKNKDTLQAALCSLCTFLQEKNIPQSAIFDCRLVACELLGNVLRHAQGTAKLFGTINDGFVELKIQSQDVFFPKETVCAEVYAENGRGLFLVENAVENELYCEEDGLLVRIRISE